MNHKKTKSKRFAGIIEREIFKLKEIDEKFTCSAWLGRFLTVNNCEIYELNDIEDHLTAEIENYIKYPNIVLEKQNNILHVASEVYKYGGHTRLIKSLVNISGNGESDLLLTRKTTLDKIPRDIVEVFPNIFIVNETISTSVVLSTVNRSLNYKKIILHIHPDDIETAVAINIVKKIDASIEVYFINHSDHSFSYGHAAANSVLEISGYGWGLRKYRGSQDRSTFLGIPISCKPIKSNKEDGLIISGGNSYKFRSFAGRTLKNIILKLLSNNTNYKVILIGPSYLTSTWILLVKLHHPKRFSVIPRLSFNEYINTLSKCSLYIDSYPMTGGTAFTEALINGLSVLGLSGGPNGYGIADILRQTSDDQLVSKAISILEKDRASLDEQERVREFAKNYHSGDEILGRYNRIVKYNEIIQPPDIFLGNKITFGHDNHWEKLLAPHCPGFRTKNELKYLKSVIKYSLNSNMGLIFIAQLFTKALHAKYKKG